MEFSKQEYWESVATPFSIGIFPTQDQSCASWVSCTAGEFFIYRATWEAQNYSKANVTQ